jgi:hypothetical protein
MPEHTPDEEKKRKDSNIELREQQESTNGWTDTKHAVFSGRQTGLLID